MTDRVIYTITVASRSKTKEIRWREWGYYFNQTAAAKVIEENQTDISEMGYYRYGLLSSKGEGPLAIPEPIQWYEFIWEGDKFVGTQKITCPDEFKHICFV